jgi:hypothetical protein
LVFFLPCEQNRDSCFVVAFFDANETK